jgi:hypothetical protein
MITGMRKHFIFHIRWIYILRYLYFKFFSVSFCITFLSDDIATSISKHSLYFSFYLVCLANLPEPVCTSWFYNTVIQSVPKRCIHKVNIPYYNVYTSFWDTLYICVHVPTEVSVSTSFLLFQCPVSCILCNVDVHRLHHVLLCIHSLPEWDILMLGGQKCLRVLYIVVTCFEFFLSESDPSIIIDNNNCDKVQIFENDTNRSKLH